MRYMVRISIVVMSIVWSTTVVAKKRVGVTPAQTITKSLVKDITPTRGDLAHDGTNPVTIDEAGVYRLTGNMTGNGTTDLITISANNVTLDLDGSTLDNGTQGIVISGDVVTVKNGVIQNCATTGMVLTGSAITLEDIDVVGTPTGFYFNGARYARVTDCSARECTNTGFLNHQGAYNRFENCTVSDLDGQSNVYGFLSHLGAYNSFISCDALNVATTMVTTATESSYGFKFDAEAASVIEDCTVNGVKTLANEPWVYGMMMTTSQLNDTLFVNSDRTGQSPVWLTIQDRIYLAIGGQDPGSVEDEVFVLRYDPQAATLTEVATGDSLGLYALTVDWLVSGTRPYLVAGFNASSAKPEIRIFEFVNESTLNLVATKEVSSNTACRVFSLQWNTIDGTDYLAFAGREPEFQEQVRIYSFDGSSLTQEVGINYQSTTNSTAWATRWLTFGDTNYLAIGAQGAGYPEITIYQFDASTPSLTEVASYEPGTSIRDVDWLVSPNGSYYLAGGGFDGNVYIFSFDAAAAAGSRLILKATYNGAGHYYGVRWLPGAGAIHSLALGMYDTVPGNNRFRIIRFDENDMSNLSIVYDYVDTDYYFQVDNLALPDRNLFAIAINGNTTTKHKVRVLDISLEGYNNIVKNNLVHNVTGGSNAIGYAVPANDTDNLMIDNVAYNNDTNYNPLAADSSNRSF